MDVLLPRWSFEIDVCRRSEESWPEQSPLERKLAQVERHSAGPRPESDCFCTPDPVPCRPTDPCCAKVNYYIADLLELRDWTHRYKAGDLAYIENVAAGETRSRDHEMKRTRELFSETEISQRQSETRDLQVTDRASLKREIDRQTEQSFSAEAKATADFWGGSYKATISASASFARSSSEAVRDAQEQAIETVRKAVSEIEKETRTKRSEKITTEETEKNIHAFTNTTDEALVTKYFWVTKECRAQLYSYGRQMIAEFIVPEPARLYEHLTEMKLTAEVDKRIRPPRGKLPERPELGITAEQLNGENYKDLCQLWGVKDPPPWPKPTDELSDNEVDDWRARGDPVLSQDVELSHPCRLRSREHDREFRRYRIYRGKQSSYGRCRRRGRHPVRRRRQSQRLHAFRTRLDRAPDAQGLRLEHGAYPRLCDDASGSSARRARSVAGLGLQSPFRARRGKARRI